MSIDKSGLKPLRTRYLTRALFLLDVGGPLRDELPRLRQRWNADHPQYPVMGREVTGDMPPNGLLAENTYFPERFVTETVTIHSQRGARQTPEYRAAGMYWRAFLREVASRYWCREDFPNPFDWQEAEMSYHPGEAVVSAALIMDPGTWVSRKRIDQLLPRFYQPIDHWGGDRSRLSRVIAERDALEGELRRLLADDPERWRAVQRASWNAGIAATSNSPMIPTIPLVPGSSAEDVRRILPEAISWAHSIYGERRIRERVRDLVAAGTTEAAIADQLGITARAVSKLKAESPTE